MFRALRRFILGMIVVFLASTGLVVAALKWIDPPTSAFMLASPQEVTGPSWTDWENISPWLPLAIIAAEDQKFPAHWGFDPGEIKLAIIERVQQGRIRGASTITQQLAKNLFLWPEKSWLRKGLEAWFTLLLEVLLTKQRILELYMNVAEFGPYTFSAGTAAQAYFSKTPKLLSLQESCMLAAVLPNPRELKIDDPSQDLKSRANRIRKQITALGGRGYLDRILHEGGR